MNPSTALATVLVDELVRGGVRDAVVSPGSRSAPIALALAAEQRIRLHVRIDERSAGFLALGLAKVSGRVVPVLCSSGTATANLHPAVQEAAAAHVGILVLTADRPPELRGTGANQTTDQHGLYGTATRSFVDLGVAENVPGSVRYWRSVVSRLVASAVDGPVHVNVPIRATHTVAEEQIPWCEPLDGRPGGALWSCRVRPAGSPEVLREAPERGVVVVGDGALDPAAALALAEDLGWPVLSEPTGNARTGPHAVACYPSLLADPDFARRHRPDLVVCVGKPGLTRSLLAWLGTAARLVVVDPHADWADPTRTAAQVLPVVPIAPARRDAGDWLDAWLAADRAATAALDRILDDGPGWSEPRLARDLVAAVPAGGLLVLGASRPVRDVELAARPRDGLTVLSNRGVSGIDGVVSTAVGAALAHQHAGGGPATALLGDLSFLHDQNGLVLGPDEPRPDLTAVVVDNDGGGIFSTLEHAEVEHFERVLGTPHGVGLAHVAAATGTPFADADTPADLLDALDRAGAGRPGIGIVRVRTDRAAGAALLPALQAAIGAALAR